MKHLLQFLRTWTLPIAMLVGVAEYVLGARIPSVDVKQDILQAVGILQPALIFVMLLLTFCKVRLSDLRLRRWHAWLLLMQTGTFALGAWGVTFIPSPLWRAIVESGLLCMLCPTATAAAVVTGKLGGNQGTLTTYTILINIAVSILLPLMVPMLHPAEEHTFLHSFLLLVGKVFPLLVCPLLAASLLRLVVPSLVEWLARRAGMAFYIWAFSLSLAIAVTARSIASTPYPFVCELGIAVSSLVACIVQFAVGRIVGKKYGEPVSAAQSAGQKNTVFAIWIGYTFLDPVTSLAGGFYSVWHNVYNSYQLYRANKH